MRPVCRRGLFGLPCPVFFLGLSRRPHWASRIVLGLRLDKRVAIAAFPSNVRQGEQPLPHALRVHHPIRHGFGRGLLHRQNPRFGEPGQDAAGALRANCAFGLARIGPPGLVLLLTELLLDSDDTARAGAARALGGTGSLTAVPLLRYKVRIGDRSIDVIGECFASVLTLSFEESLPFVARYLLASENALQDTAVFALAETRRPEAFAILRDYWPESPEDLRESLLVALAMFRLPAANDFLIGLIAGKDPNASAALSALAIHRDNPKITASIAVAVEANGSESVRESFRKKFPTESEAKVKKDTS